MPDPQTAVPTTPSPGACHLRPCVFIHRPPVGRALWGPGAHAVAGNRRELNADSESYHERVG